MLQKRLLGLYRGGRCSEADSAYKRALQALPLAVRAGHAITFTFPRALHVLKAERLFLNVN